MYLMVVVGDLLLSEIEIGGYQGLRYLSPCPWRILYPTSAVVTCCRTAAAAVCWNVGRIGRR